MIDPSTFRVGQPAPSDVFRTIDGQLVDTDAEGAVQIVVKGVDVDRGALVALNVTEEADRG